MQVIIILSLARAADLYALVGSNALSDLNAVLTSPKSVKVESASRKIAWDLTNVSFSIWRNYEREPGKNF